MQLRAFRHVIAVVAALAFAGAGCGGPMGGPDPAAAPRAGDGLYEIRGVIVKTDVGRRLLEIDHEAIPGFMAAMTMPYEVENASLLEGLAAGDRVKGTLRVDRRGYIITALTKV